MRCRRHLRCFSACSWFHCAAFVWQTLWACFELVQHKNHNVACVFEILWLSAVCQRLRTQSDPDTGEKKIWVFIWDMRRMFDIHTKLSRIKRGRSVIIRLILHELWQNVHQGSYVCLDGCGWVLVVFQRWKCEPAPACNLLLDLGDLTWFISDQLRIKKWGSVSSTHQSR